MNPWMKFYPSDWRADPALRSCCLGARGLWAEMMCLMHEAEPYGQLLVNGCQLTDKQLALLSGATVKEVGKYLDELESSGVFSRDILGVIYSRRMVKDGKLADEGRRAAERRWGNGDPNGYSEEKPPDEPNTQKPDTRSQKKKESRTVADATRPESMFDVFWKAYPKRKGGNPKAPAEKLFNEAVKRGAPPGQIIEALAAHAGYDVEKIGTEFIPQAVKWLRDRRWEEHTPADPQVAEERAKFMAERGYVWLDGRWQRGEDTHAAA